MNQHVIEENVDTKIGIPKHLKTIFELSKSAMSALLTIDRVDSGGGSCNSSLRTIFN